MNDRKPLALRLITFGFVFSSIGAFAIFPFVIVSKRLRCCIRSRVYVPEDNSLGVLGKTCRQSIKALLFIVLFVLIAGHSNAQSVNAIPVDAPISPNCFLDSLSILENMVDIPSKGWQDKKAMRKFYETLPSDLGGTPKFRTWMVESASSFALNSNAKAMLRLGLVDSYLPACLMTEDLTRVCREMGCLATFYLARPGYVAYSEAPGSFEKIGVPIFIDGKSFIRLGSYWPKTNLEKANEDSEGAQMPSFSFFMPSEYSRKVMLVGRDNQLELERPIATSICASPGTASGEQCTALASAIC